MYIDEIEKANNYLKMLVCQGYELLHISDKMKEDFIGKLNNSENRQYFHKKLQSIQNLQVLS